MALCTVPIEQPHLNLSLVLVSVVHKLEGHGLGLLGLDIVRVDHEARRGAVNRKSYQLVAPEKLSIRVRPTPQFLILTSLGQGQKGALIVCEPLVVDGANLNHRHDEVVMVIIVNFGGSYSDASQCGLVWRVAVLYDGIHEVSARISVSHIGHKFFKPWMSVLASKYGLDRRAAIIDEDALPLAAVELWPYAEKLLRAPLQICAHKPSIRRNKELPTGNHGVRTDIFVDDPSESGVPCLFHRVH
jgi:hypothetical protein